MTNYTESTFTAQDMKDYGDYVAYLDSAMLSPNFEKWCKERFGPTQKVIDLSVLIESGIDCTHDFLEGYGPLDNSWTEESLCEARVVPRTKYIHAWQGGECPLPEGFMVKVWFRDKQYPPEVQEASENYWESYSEESDITAFEVLGLADGYVMPWEPDNG